MSNILLHFDTERKTENRGENEKIEEKKRGNPKKKTKPNG